MTEDLGLNLAGVQVVMRLMDRMAEMEREIQRLSSQVRTLQSRGGRR